MSDQPSRTSSAAATIAFDPMALAFTADPYPLLHRLRAEDPVHRSRHGYWLLTRYDDAAAVLRNPRIFGAGNTPDVLRKRLGEGAAFAYASRRLSNYDPPDHTRLRSLVTKAFTARRVEALRPHIQAIVDGLLDAVSGAGQMDVIARLAHPLPSLVICEMLGVPEADRSQFSAWTADIALLLGPAVSPERLAIGEAAAARFMAYVRDLVRARRGRLGDDMLSALISAEDEGARLAQEELVATVVFLFSAGHQTTRDLIGNGLLGLLRHPDQWRHLTADSSLLPTAVEECFRYDSPVTFITRRALADSTIRGKEIPAGDLLWVSISAANRDPLRFVHPDRFDLDRADNDHLAFGGGIHYCLGAALARVEAQLAFGALLRRHPHLELVDGAVEWRETIAFRGPVALRVSF